MWKVLMGAVGCALICGSILGAEDKSLVAKWTFDQANGAVAKDSSGNGNDGQIHDAEYVKRGNGFALKFDGVKSYVDCGNKPSLLLDKAVTVSLWFCPDAVPEAEPALAVMGDLSYGLTYYKDGRTYWYINNGGNNLGTPLIVGEWQYLVGAYDGKSMSLYVNGKLISSKDLTQPISCTGSLMMSLRGGSFLKGQLADVAIYNRALTAGEVAAMYKAGAVAK